MQFTRTILALAALAGMAAAGQAMARDQIRIVGSSTVFPFATAVAEKFGRASEFPTPVVESTGSGGGLKLFCGGAGEDTPDIANASRRMKKSEWTLCNDNGVTAITEVVVGYDGIAVANSKSGPSFSLTRAQLYKALVAGVGEPAMWSDVDPSLPAIKIEVLGPPPSSGTRDAFEELALQEGCEEAGGADCGKVKVRADGAYIESGENDNLIVAKLEQNPNQVGVFGYSFLEENLAKLQGATVDGVSPTFDTIADGSYPLARTMYFYVKKAHIGAVPGLVEYMVEFVSPEASGSGGYLSKIGLVPLPDAAHAANARNALSLAQLTGSEF